MRICGDIQDLLLSKLNGGPALTTRELAEITGLEQKSVRNALNHLMRTQRAVRLNSNEDREGLYTTPEAMQLTRPIIQVALESRTPLERVWCQQ